MAEPILELLIVEIRMTRDRGQRTPESSLRDDAVRIWRAGVEAVDSERLVEGALSREGEKLCICGRVLDVNRIGRLAVVGAGKAGAGMAAAFERAVGDDVLRGKLEGWVNVPADCVRPLQRIHLHAARPAGVNEPQEAGVAGAQRILDIVGALGPQDVCVVLLSGGGSALLPAPVPPLGLQELQAVTRLLMRYGATINELNCVRKQLSRIKGGRLARACNAGLTISLIISDVIGDPLDVIASGPTVPDTGTPLEARAVLRRFLRDEADVPAAVFRYLDLAIADAAGEPPFPRTVYNHVIGNNAVALRAAAEAAQDLGYAVHSLGSDNAGEARRVGAELAELAAGIRDAGRPLSPPACVLSGGEPVVHLAVPTAGSHPAGKGGRNQELVLGGLQRLWDDGMPRIVLLSGGTDGEDGPTDAAGAVADAQLLQNARESGLRPEEFLALNNSYVFFDRTGGLLKTGPTHTNVMDLRVALVRSERSAAGAVSPASPRPTS